MRLGTRRRLEGSAKALEIALLPLSLALSCSGKGRKTSLKMENLDSLLRGSEPWLVAWGQPQWMTPEGHSGGKTISCHHGECFSPAPS